MAGQHGINVVPEDDSQGAINEASALEQLHNKLWDDNEMNSMKMQLARERLIAGSIAAKIVFNSRTGKLHWIEHKATDAFPVYSKAGFNDVNGRGHIVAQA